MPKVIKILLIVNFALFIIDSLTRGEILSRYFALNTLSIRRSFELWRLCTYSFLHGLYDILHIGFNMLMLWMFSRPLISDYGEKRFLNFYLLAGIFAGLCTCIVDIVMNKYSTVVGASGAVTALLVLFALHYPNQEIYPFGLFPIKAKWLVGILIFLDLFAMTNPVNHRGISFTTHLGGAVFGFIYFRYSGSVASYWEKWKRRRQTTLGKKAAASSRQAKEAMEDIDVILKKISREGMDSLTESEKKVLNRASEAKRKQKDKIIRLEDYKHPKQ
jgi:membrane associated rhomboid family serine protease